MDSDVAELGPAVVPLPVDLRLNWGFTHRSLHSRSVGVFSSAKQRWRIVDRQGPFMSVLSARLFPSFVLCCAFPERGPFCFCLVESEKRHRAEVPTSWTKHHPNRAHPSSLEQGNIEAPS